MEMQATLSKLQRADAQRLMAALRRLERMGINVSDEHNALARVLGVRPVYVKDNVTGDPVRTLDI